MIDGADLTLVDFCSIRATKHIMSATGQGLRLSHTALATLILLHLAASDVQLLLHDAQLTLKFCTRLTIGVPLCYDAGNLGFRGHAP